MFKRLYHWTLSLAQSRRAPVALGVVSFAESSFFPIPPDVLLVPMALAKPQRAMSYATICTLTSVAGGMLGYVIGALLWDPWVQNIFVSLGWGGHVATIKAAYAQWGWAFILIKGLTPIPYKIVTILSGALDYNFALFVVLSIITRGARFFLLAGLMNTFAGPIKRTMENFKLTLFGAAMTITLIAFATIAGAWIFEAFGYLPCELCLKQRWAYYIGVPLAAATTFIAARGESLARPLLWLLALLFFGSMVFGIYHSGVEWGFWPGPTACTGAATTASSMDDFMKQLQTTQVVQCDKVAIRIFGLSLAGWNAVISAAMSWLAVTAARAKP
jgi:membrane protein YqaA with SNARE-associated domain/disulfide bond formation protein DsbB